MRDELLKGLTDEQKAKVVACKSVEEILALAKADGVELNDEQLSAVAGGCMEPRKCPKCSSEDYVSEPVKGSTSVKFRCKKCGHSWIEDLS